MSDLNTKTRSIEVKYNNQQVATFLTAYRNYNLNPVFQRKSVWKISDRQMFIKTILEGMPCPTVFVMGDVMGDVGSEACCFVTALWQVASLLALSLLTPFLRART